MLKRIGHYTILTLFALIFALPILYMVVASFKSPTQLLRDGSSIRMFLPVGEISFRNYGAVFRRAPVVRFIFNSALITITTVMPGLFFNSMAAFSFAILRWRGKNIILTIIIATLVIPFEAIAIPLLLLVNQLPWLGINGFSLGWLNTYHVQIIPFIADALSLFLFVQFFKDLPYDLFEVARIDGANWFQIYLRIAVPISGPVFATVAIIRALFMWNQYLWPVMVVQSEKFRPIMIGVQYYSGSYGEVMAYLSIITIPMLILFLRLQSMFIKSIASTSIKG